MTEEKFAECMRGIAGGDQAALREVYEEYLPYLYTVVYGILQNRESAEDVSTDVFLRLWKTANRYRPGNGHKGYLATIARNMAIDALRRRGREVLVDDFSAAAAEGGGRVGASTEDEEGGPARGYAVSESRQHGADGEGVSPEAEVLGRISVEEALAMLRPAEREVVDMKILSEMTFQEISDVLGVPMGTVTSRYREAIRKLRRCGYGKGI